MQTTDLSLVGDAVSFPVSSAQAGDARLEAVLAMTRELFPGEVAVRRKFDPEIADEAYHSIRVSALGSVAEIAGKDALWHHRLLEIAPDAIGLYRLSMNIP